MIQIESASEPQGSSSIEETTQQGKGAVASLLLVLATKNHSSRLDLYLGEPLINQTHTSVAKLFGNLSVPICQRLRNGVGARLRVSVHHVGEAPIRSRHR